MTAALARSPEWHAERRTGIGASDVPAIAGLSPFAKPIDVWQDKLGLVDARDETPMTRWGTLLEPVVADEFAVVTGKKVRRLARAVRFKDWPVLFAHLDRTVVGGGILEVKTSVSTRGWGQDGSSDVPDHVALQVQAQLACADHEVAHIAALLGYRDFRVYTLQRDREMFGDLILPLLQEFWRLVETETPPEPDGSDSYASFLRRAHTSDDGITRIATPEESLIATQLAGVRADRIAAEIREEELLQRLQAAMADTAKLDGPGWHATWKQNKPSARTDWKALADELLPLLDAERHPLIEKYTDTKPGARPFRFVVTDAAEEDNAA